MEHSRQVNKLHFYGGRRKALLEPVPLNILILQELNTKTGYSWKWPA